MVTTVAALQLRRKHGFVRRSITVPGEAAALNYWYRPPAANRSRATPPLVLLHGIGPGGSLTAWMTAGRLEMVNLEHSAVIVPELPNIAYECWAATPHALTARQTAAAIAQAVRDANGGAEGPGAICIGQSFGTIVITWLMRYQPQTVCAALMLDPVVFLMHHAALAYRFLYRQARTPQQKFLRYFASDEIGIQHVRSTNHRQSTP